MRKFTLPGWAIGVLALAVVGAIVLINGTADSRRLYLSAWLEQDWPAELRALDADRPPAALCAVIDLRPGVDRSRKLDFARKYGPILLRVRCGLRLFGVDVNYEDAEYRRVDRAGARGWGPEPTCVVKCDAQGEAEYSLVKYERIDIHEASHSSGSGQAERDSRLALDLARELERLRREVK
ncbi:MAG: hypothetical protein K8T90_14020 [Planctomycetes bacterium]|nr:hypothetical protein [Planctomycetota bacterium]